MIKKRINNNWLFQVGGGNSFVIKEEIQHQKKVNLPHDAAIEMERNAKEPKGSGNGYFQENSYVYTKRLKLNPEDFGKNVWIEFEGIYQNSFIYVNGSFAGQNPYGYGNFYIDITRYLCFEEGRENELKVIVKNGVPSGRWYTGGGIFRDVNLMVADRLHIIPDGVQLTTTDIDSALAVLKVKTRIEYTGLGTRGIYIVTKLKDADGNLVAEDRMPITIQEHTNNDYQQRIYVHNPKLWSDKHPYLYSYEVCLYENDAILDEEIGTYGIRKLQLDHDNGLRVNGEVVKLRGGCIHHDNGITGTAEFKHTAEFRVSHIKKAGYNAIRSSHYPMSRRLLDACDKYGIYVMDEFSDVWTSTKVDYDYGTHMATWWEQDVSNMVRKDYNHPCVILYSIGNEIPETGNKFDVQWGKKIADKIREFDHSRYVTNSVNLMFSLRNSALSTFSQANILSDQNKNNGQINDVMNELGSDINSIISKNVVGDVVEEAATQVDVIGYNYGTARYEIDGEKYPNRIIVGSETYPRDLDTNWELVLKYPYIIGDFDWTAWDYLGESGIGRISYDEKARSFCAEYPYKAAYCGDINLLGDRRPISYWREIIWGLRKDPYIAVQPPEYYKHKQYPSNWAMTNAVRSWNWNGYEEEPIVVEVYGEGDEIELRINDEVVGRKQVGNKKKDMVLFDTKYQSGKIEAILYKQGRIIGRDCIMTASDNVRLKADIDVESIPSDGSDIGYIEISLVDELGYLNPDVKKKVSVQVSGPVKVVGFGSADPQSEENYFDQDAATYEGRLRAAIRGKGEKGAGLITFHADGCNDITVNVKVE